MDPASFLRGNPFPATRSVPYPRARPGDGRIPGDTWYTASFPVGVRLDIAGDAEAVEITYTCKGPDATWPGEGGRSFECWRGDERLASLQADDDGTVELPLGTIYLPERLAPTITSIEPAVGSIEPAPRGPRWICYGDSIAEGWVASSPALAWPSIVARTHGLDLVNMAYAGAARGELVSAEQIASLEADVIALTHGTNCWNRVPFSESLMRENTIAFLSLVRSGHPGVPIVMCSPPVRPEAEDTPNALGATLADLRRAMAEAAKAFDGVTFVDGLPIVSEAGLADNVHPNDAGHRALADALGPVIAEAAHGA